MESPRFPDLLAWNLSLSYQLIETRLGNLEVRREFINCEYLITVIIHHSIMRKVQENCKKLSITINYELLDQNSSIVVIETMNSISPIS